MAAEAGAHADEELGWQASGSGGAVAAGQPAAVAAGIAILDAGGNAADAAVAALLALSITDYGLYAIGAEIPLMVYDAGRKNVRVLCGLGAAPLDPESRAWYYRNGIPSQGGIKAAPVPGAPDLCLSTLALYGTMAFADVVAPALALLDAGTESWHPGLATTFRRLADTEAQTPGTRQEKLRAARDRFYRGDIADELVAFYTREGSFLRKADLAAHRTRIEDPVTVRYRGLTVCKCDTWTQGPSLCQALRLLEGFDLKGMGHMSTDCIHVVAEALKLGFADRDEYYGDPRFARVPLDGLLSDRYTRLRRSLIDVARASLEVRPGDPVAMKAIKEPRPQHPTPGGTTTCVTADRWGNLVAATPSGNGPYAVCEELGIAHGNRLRSLNTAPGHPNAIEPGKRPRITLTPTLVLRDGRGVMALSVAGGDLQETTLNLLLNHIDFGMMPAEAVTAPRCATGHHQDSFDPNPDRKQARQHPGSLTVSPDVAPDAVEKLVARGHKVKTADGPIAAPTMLCLDPDSGMMHVAGDPAAGRHAAAVE